MQTYILAPQLLEILLANDCFTVNNDGSNPINDTYLQQLADDFNLFNDSEE